MDVNNRVHKLWPNRLDAHDYYDPKKHNIFISSGDKKSLKNLQKKKPTPQQMMKDVNANQIMKKIMKKRKSDQIDSVLDELIPSTSDKCSVVSHCSELVSIHPDCFCVHSEAVIKAEAELHGGKEKRKGLQFHIAELLDHYCECHDWTQETVDKVYQSLPKWKKVSSHL